MTVDTSTEHEGAATFAVRPFRAGTFLWRLSAKQAADLREAEDPFAIEAKWLFDLKTALQEDSRVTDISQSNLDLHYSGTETYYPSLGRTTKDAIISGSDAFEVFYFSGPIFIQIHVPTKNQPLHHGADDIPSEDYVISWDGTTVVVAWEQEDEALPLSGGHIARSILEAAVEQVGSSLYDQACTPMCRNLFFHSVGVLRESIDPGSEPTYHSSLEHRGVDVSVPSADDLEDALKWFLLDTSLTIHMFAEFKNVGRRLLDVHKIAEAATSRLLALQYFEASAAMGSRIMKIKRFRTSTANRREMRSLLATAWLCISHIETLRRQWSELENSLAHDDSRPFIEVFLATDFAGDRQRVRDVQTAPLRAALDNVSVRLDASAMVMTTALGGLAGAVAGFVSAILSYS